MKCKLCGFQVGDKVHMRSANMPGKTLRGFIEAWHASCGHLANWKEIGENGEFKPFVSADGLPIMATPTYVPDMKAKNTNVVLVTEKLPEVRRP